MVHERATMTGPTITQLVTVIETTAKIGAFSKGLSSNPPMMSRGPQRNSQLGLPRCCCTCALSSFQSTMELASSSMRNSGPSSKHPSVAQRNAHLNFKHLTRNTISRLNSLPVQTLVAQGWQLRYSNRLVGWGASTADGSGTYLTR